MKLFPLLIVLLVLPAVSTQAKPNFIFILADDMGYGDPSCFGGSARDRADQAVRAQRDRGVRAVRVGEGPEY